MTTLLALHESRLAQATADRQQTEEALQQAMRAIDSTTTTTPVSEAVLMRRWEAVAEDTRNKTFGSAWSAYCRAVRIERRARTALHVAHLDAARPTPLPKSQRPRVRRSIGAGVTYSAEATT
jgi:hypothetical protein